ncbi:MAG: Crp/Fnr family transcriptional regulator [Bacteroidetes bacterium]|nr:Crp/Fnr family transcriptional regulator [Bacteroidota bacterium]
MNEAFLTFLSSFSRLSKEDIEQLAEACTEVSYAKGDYFIREGEVCHKIGFLISGIARVYHIANDKEYTSYFNFPQRNRMVATFESFLIQKPSKENIHFLQDSVLILIPRTKLYELYETSPAMQEMGRKLAEYNYVLAMERIYALQHDTAQMRYEKLLHIYADLVNMVPHHYIASYLGITPESMSRIRKELMG